MEKLIQNTIEDFLADFHNLEIENDIKINELNNDIIKEILIEFFNKKTFSEADEYYYQSLDDYVTGKNEHINWNLDRKEVEQTIEYKRWKRYSTISRIWYVCRRNNNLSQCWTKINGKTHTDEEAAKIASDKWCELLFGWHLQDNGALNETHGGGFPACALGTILAEESKKNITEDMKQKAHELLQEYYKRLIHYSNTGDYKDIEWLKTTLKPIKEEYDWKFGFDDDMYCDYNPCWALYIILENAGIPERVIDNICPWKTGISIRIDDNAVMYNTYQSRKEL